MKILLSKFGNRLLDMTKLITGVGGDGRNKIEGVRNLRNINNRRGGYFGTVATV